MRRAQVAIGCDPSQDPIGFTRASAWAFLHRTGALSTGWKDFDANVSLRDPVGGADGRGPYTAGYGLMIAQLAVRLGIAPSILWDQEPRDLATLVSLVADDG